MLRYLRGNAKLNLVFQILKMGKLRVLQESIDAYYARDLDEGRSTMSYVFTVSECVVSWKAEL